MYFLLLLLQRSVTALIQNLWRYWVYQGTSEAGVLISTGVCQPIRATRGLIPLTPTCLLFSISSRCANISFTKNPEKYHKYRPDEVEEMIERLFDTSAWAAPWTTTPLTRVPRSPRTTKRELFQQRLRPPPPRTTVALVLCDECFVPKYAHDVFM